MFADVFANLFQRHQTRVETVKIAGNVFKSGLIKPVRSCVINLEIDRFASFANHFVLVHEQICCCAQIGYKPEIFGLEGVFTNFLEAHDAGIKSMKFAGKIIQRQLVKLFRSAISIK